MSALEELLQLAATAPPLPGARCRGRWELFDATVSVGRNGDPEDLDYVRNAALRLCHQCPSLDACSAWLASLPVNGRPLGVVAGQVVARPSWLGG